MGLFSWLSQLFGSTPATPKQVRVPPLPPRPGAAPAPAAATSKTTTASTPKKLKLDAGQFAPISRKELKDAFGKVGRWTWGNPWFGRRDLIPPVTDERTVLIDRALVANGLLTPEELVEIHEVGAKMGELRPQMAHVEAAGKQAEQLDKEARQALKAQKKFEAAAKRQRHVEAVAQRRATDIVFLGRGVSGGLADRRANVEKLQAAELPVLATPADVAQALGLTIPRLRWLAFHSEASTTTHYVRFQVPKKSGGVRELAAPHRELALAQEWILEDILENCPLYDAAHGFVKGRSTMTNAVPHVRRHSVVNLDLKDFFPSITFPRVKGIFQGIGYSPAVATVLALLCTESPRRRMDYGGKVLHVASGPRALPQGACTSPALSNLLARRLDARLTGLAAKLGFTYTRYADDLTFSGDAAAAAKTGYLLTRVRHLIADERLEVNEKKTRVQRTGARQSVTGIVVNQRPNIPRPTLRKLRAILHDARKNGLEAANREQRENFPDWLGGMIAYVTMVNPNKGRLLAREFEQIRG
jgi:retron-type reverse transcriptase